MEVLEPLFRLNALECFANSSLIYFTGERKAFEVYSCDVSPDGSRLVTAAGGASQPTLPLPSPPDPRSIPFRTEPLSLSRTNVILV